MTDTWMALSVRQGTGEVVRDHPSPALVALRPWIERAVRDERLADRIMLRCELVRDQENGPGEDVDEADFVARRAPKVR